MFTLEHLKLTSLSLTRLKCSSSSSTTNHARLRPTPFFTFLNRSSPPHQLFVTTPRRHHCASSSSSSAGDVEFLIKPNNTTKSREKEEKSFWGAVGLIVGTAVGPGMLSLPAATLRSGPLLSTLAILASWVYVIASIILVAELSFAVMEEDGAAEVSFTALATKALGTRLGGLVALVYASLNFSLLVASVSGIGSIVSHRLPSLSPLAANSLCPLAVGAVIFCFPFAAIDAANRALCFLMLLSIAALVGVGSSSAACRTNLLGSPSAWRIWSILPAVPVTVLTLGFHVITPLVCKIAGNTVAEARRAILVGGVFPLIMVLSWNLVVLGLSGGASSLSSDPISLLLSVKSSTAATAVQLFAFSALATSLIGYCVSFPKQLVDTLDLIISRVSTAFVSGGNVGRVGLVTYSSSSSSSSSSTEVATVGGLGNAGRALFPSGAADKPIENYGGGGFVTPLVLTVSTLIASFFPSAFSKALDFAGVYANCFLFGILPPLMSYIFQSKKKLRSDILPGKDGALILLFCIAVALGIWH